MSVLTECFFNAEYYDTTFFASYLCFWSQIYLWNFFIQGAKKPDPKAGAKGKAAPGKAKKEGGGKAKKKACGFTVIKFWYSPYVKELWPQSIYKVNLDFNGGYWNRNPTMWKLPLN